ncbi:hypothetical protein [Bradyrhizobium sp. SSUT77]|uniref:hypothetical protein n=1 Tax=Bradyrhizobium sp. SSUT77 TaxID=3040603 RepID=UPI00244717D0|nr:hypothetical protein [Bradyrhizobium sp. SSUT77]MDH2347649.1 hypothetical protein [Bradyrhizobium sp. SSUT77]
MSKAITLKAITLAGTFSHHHHAIKRGDCEINWQSNRSQKIRDPDSTTGVRRAG